LTIDVLYLCHGRLEFTMATLPTLLALTPWNEVQEFVVYNDAAPDHPDTYDWLRELDDPRIHLRDTNLGSPVAVMLHFLARSKAELFAKIDNDIVVPPYWFETMVTVMERNPDLILLGTEPGMSGVPPIRDGQVGKGGGADYTPARHIGGVGMMRRSGFDALPAPVPDGRFGFTEWQHTYEPERGWIAPDMRCFPLDMIPVEPWVSLTAAYKKIAGLQRDWSPYDPSMSYYWEWWTEMVEARPAWATELGR
jgi:hypothetical protein